MSPVDQSGGGGEDIKFNELTQEQTLARFDKYKEHTFYPYFAESFGSMFGGGLSGGHWPLKVFKRDKNLPELILKLRKDGYYPLIDKSSNLAFALTAHRMTRALLYALYSNLSITPQEFFAQQEELADRWTAEGMGYFWTSMGGTHAIGARKYRPTKVDRETWLMVAGEEGDLTDEVKS